MMDGLFASAVLCTCLLHKPEIAIYTFSCVLHAYLQTAPDKPILRIVSGLLRLTFPITAAFYLIKITFRLGATKKRDKYALLNAVVQQHVLCPADLHLISLSMPMSMPVSMPVSMQVSMPTSQCIAAVFVSNDVSCRGFCSVGPISCPAPAYRPPLVTSLHSVQACQTTRHVWMLCNDRTEEPVCCGTTSLQAQAHDSALAATLEPCDACNKLLFLAFKLLRTEAVQIESSSSCPKKRMKFITCRLFGGARLDMVTSKDSAISFADIAGVDQVKAEIVELVQFLKNPKKFLDLGARSPAGVLLVGPPGTGLPSIATQPIFGLKVSIMTVSQLQVH